MVFSLVSQLVEELAQLCGTFLPEDTAHQLGVVGKILHEEIQHAAAGAHDAVPRTVEHTADTGVNDGTCTHGAGL